MKKLIIATIIFTFSFLLYVSSVFAQPLELSLSPAIVTVKTDGRNDTTVTVNIKNETNHNISYNVELIPFEPSLQKNGEPILLDKIDKDYGNLFQSITFLDNDIPITKIDLAPKQKKSIKILIDPPTTLKKGDYYFSAIFTSLPTSRSETETTVSINQAGAINILLSFGKQNKPHGEIKELKSPKFVNKGPISLSLDIYNQSKSFITAYGNISIKNMFGQTVGSFDLEPTNILADSERVINTSWTVKFLLGIYNVKVDVSLSKSGPILTKETKFFAFPLEFSIIALVSTAILVFLGSRIIKKRLQN